jgi:hypothetical protein
VVRIFNTYGPRMDPADGRVVRPDDGAKTGDAQVAVTPTPPDQSTANSLPDPADWKPGPAEDALPGLIPRPAKLPGIRRWQAETIAFRGEITALAWQPGGDLVACGTSLGDIRLYEPGECG